MYALGLRYRHGEGVTEDANLAAQWFSAAAEKGHARAMFQLGGCYQSGTGVPRLMSVALRWFNAAAEKGEADAMFCLGVSYAVGSGVAKDAAAAVEWFRAAAENGNCHAMVHMGKLCIGTGNAKDAPVAARWFRAAAEKGDADAIFNLGECYANGTGVAKDAAAAGQYYRAAADNGNFDAMYKLSRLYKTGKGVAKDAVLARLFKSASQKDKTALAAIAALPPAPALALATSSAATNNAASSKSLPVLPPPQVSPTVAQKTQPAMNLAGSAENKLTATQLVGGLQWINEELQALEFETDEDRELLRQWLMKTFKTSTSVALQALGAVDEIVAAAKVVTVVLRVAMAVAVAHERAKANDGRVAQLCARLSELRAIMEQTGESLGEQTASVVSGKSVTSSAAALRAPLDRLLDAVKAAREAIDAWQEVSRAAGADKWAKFKRWAGRIVKSSAHADTLVEANDELQSALQQIGAVASIRAALNSAGGADDDLKAWLKLNAERDDEFRAAMHQDTSEIKQMVTKLLPDIDKLLTRHLSGVNEKLDQLLGANIEKLPFDSFEHVRELGEGAYGAIVAMRCKKLGRAPVAVKKLVLSGHAAEDKKRKERLLEEARLMKQFKHQHIVQFYGQVVTPANDLWLVMELLDKSLEKFIAELAGDHSKWPMDDRKRVGHEIALGLEYLHGKGVLHRDLKSPNVMLTAVERQAKLIDFGLSKDTNSAKNKSSTIQGSSSLWMAPEVNSNEDFSQASDVYALGIVLTEIVLLELPSMNTMRKVSQMTGEWKVLIDMCTEEKPGDRARAVQCADKLNF
jgi:TPR repeat protein